MYITLKIRMRMKEFQKEQLLEYEQLFMEQRKDLVKQMELSHQTKFAKMIFYDSIPSKCRWQVYRLAMKQYLANMKKKESQYHRSSSWASQSIHYKNGILALDMVSHTIYVSLSICTEEEDMIYKSKIIRLDIVHDEKFWYANFILQRKELEP